MTTSHEVYAKLRTTLSSDLDYPWSTTMDVSSVATASRSLLMLSIFRKSMDTEGGMSEKDLEVKAKASFFHTEVRCAETNSRFRRGRHREFTMMSNAVLDRARLKIGSLIGDWDYVEAFRQCSHGKGSTRTVTGDSLGIDTKYDEKYLSVTSDSLDLARCITQGVGWAVARGINASGPCSLANGEWVLSVGDSISFVRKNATSLRPISIGPTLNVYMQLGVGTFLANRLKKWGINLTDQTVNSNLACWGSLTGDLATLDLKSASALLSRMLVMDLIPHDLYLLLDRLRCKDYLLDDTLYTYEMFSGMGNGFTFPLQTIIFHALAVAVCDELGVSSAWCATYGDDMIVPVEVYDTLCAVLNDLGLIVNGDKSFATGPFRESCGGQYYDGHDIRPVYWKGFKSKDITCREVCLLAHQLHLWSDRTAYHSHVSLSQTLSYLRRLAFKLDRACPVVPINAPMGSGFPEPWCALDEISLRRFVFYPLRRVGRDDALYAYGLDANRKQDQSVRQDEVLLHALEAHLGLPLTDFWCHEIDIRGHGNWAIKRSRLLLGFYPR